MTAIITAAHLTLLAVILALAIILALMFLAVVSAVGVLCGVWFVWVCNAALIAVAATIFTRTV